MTPPLTLLGLLTLPLLTSAFTFTLSSPPSVCQNLSLSWSGGTAPYEITLLPLGYVSPEIRTLVDVNTSSTSWSEQLLFPSGSTFVIVLSDATGYGTGGTSTVQTVGGGDSSCLPTSPSSLPFTFYMNPETPSQCSNLAFTWDSAAQGQVVISGVIPGGDSFQIPTSQGTSQQWTANVAQGTEIAFIVGDSRGRGKGGSSDLMTVGGGSGSCLGGNSPSSTQAPAAGAVSTASSSNGGGGSSESASSSYPPGSNGGTVTGSPIATGRGGSGQQGQSSGGSSTSTSNTGAIVGGVVGGIAALLILALLLFCFMRRRRRAHQAETEKGQARADLLDAAPAVNGSASVAGNGSVQRNGRWYQQEPFVPPTTQPAVQSSRRTPSTANATEGPVSSWGHSDPSHPSSSPTSAHPPFSLPAGAAAAQPPRPDTTGDAAMAAQAAQHDPKKRSPSQLARRRPVNWVQHDDAGAVQLRVESPPPPDESAEGGGEPVVVDVPPSYEALQRGGRQ